MRQLILLMCSAALAATAYAGSYWGVDPYTGQYYEYYQDNNGNIYGNENGQYQSYWRNQNGGGYYWTDRNGRFHQQWYNPN